MLFVPPLFVILWATGFVTARLVAPHIEPMTFLFLRFALAASALTLLALLSRAPWPRTPREWGVAAAIGLLLQGIYLGGVFWAVKHGLPAAVCSLVVSTQPLLISLVAGPLLGERISLKRRVGVGVGILGVALVLAPKLAGAESYPIPALIASLGSLASISIATIWQKRAGNSLDLRSGTAIQFGASALAALPFAYATETMAIEQTPQLWVGLLWSAFGLSIGAIFLLLMMIRRGAIVAVSSWLFLVPPAAAIMNFLAFGETLAPIQILGMAVAALGVALTTRG